jgi:hypothetical protein
MYVVARGFTFDGGIVLYGPFLDIEKAEAFITSEKETDNVSAFKVVEITPLTTDKVRMELSEGPNGLIRVQFTTPTFTVQPQDAISIANNIAGAAVHAMIANGTLDQFNQSFEQKKETIN